MGEAISGLVSQQLQQTAQSQTFKQNPAQTTNGKSFEAHLQDKVNAGDQTKAERPKTDTAAKLEQIQAELQKNTQAPNSDLTKTPPNSDLAKTMQMMRDLMNENGGRMSMLKDAYSKLGKKGAVPNDLRGTLINTEGEWKAVHDIMNSNKNLSQGELLALQQRLYMVSQHVEVMSKVVDQMAGGIKTVLNTNI